MADRDVTNADGDGEELRPSKSAKKREMTALQQLGTRLVQLPPAQLEQIPIDDARLSEAIQQARRISQRGGLRRQLQYIGKLMRDIDPAPIQAALAQLDGLNREQSARLHQLEQLRDALLNESDAALGAVLNAFPGADRQHLRQLVRGFDPTGPRAREQGRKLFRYLRELQEESDPES